MLFLLNFLFYIISNHLWQLFIIVYLFMLKFYGCQFKSLRKTKYLYYCSALPYCTSKGNLTDQNDHTALPYLVKDQALISPNHQRLSNYAPYFLELPNWAALPFYSTLLEKIVENWNFNEYSLHPVSKYSWKFKF